MKEFQIFLPFSRLSHAGCHVSERDVISRDREAYKQQELHLVLYTHFSCRASRRFDDSVSLSPRRGYAASGLHG